MASNSNWPLILGFLVFCNFMFFGYLIGRAVSSLPVHHDMTGLIAPELRDFTPEEWISEESGYDVVTVVHHDDMDTLFNYGLQSFQDKLVDLEIDARIYVVGTEKAMDKLNERISSDGNDRSSVWNRVYPVSEKVFPFSLADLNNKNSGKPTWIFQQLLKMYASRVLKDIGLPFRRKYLVIDADTVLTNPIYMREPEGSSSSRSFVCIASESSGAFKNDANAAGWRGWGIVDEMLGNNFTKAFPGHNKEIFTGICHHMLFDSVFLEELFDFIEKQFKVSAWKALSSLKNSFLSEYELYLAFVMNKHRQTLAARQVAYVNWGRSDEETHEVAASFGLAFLTNHDEWTSKTICCVNSMIPSRVLSKLTTPTPECKCCPSWDCAHTHINCQILGIHGCRDVSNQAGDYMIFE